MPEEDHPEIKGAAQDLSEESDVPVGEPWPMTADDLCEKWDITSGKLKLLVKESKLPAYHKGFEGRSRVNPTDSLWTVVGRPHFWYFMSDDIEEFEREHPELFLKTNLKDKAGVKKLRPDQRHRERCRALAQHEWSKRPDTTIADMIQWETIFEIGCEKKRYKPKTLHDWINDLCPNRKPGRRPID